MHSVGLDQPAGAQPMMWNRGNQTWQMQSHLHLGGVKLKVRISFTCMAAAVLPASLIAMKCICCSYPANDRSMDTHRLLKQEHIEWSRSKHACLQNMGAHAARPLLVRCCNSCMIIRNGAHACVYPCMTLHIFLTCDCAAPMKLQHL